MNPEVTSLARKSFFMVQASGTAALQRGTGFSDQEGFNIRFYCKYTVLTPDRMLFKSD